MNALARRSVTSPVRRREKRRQHARDPDHALTTIMLSSRRFPEERLMARRHESSTASGLVEPGAACSWNLLPPA